VNPKYTIIWCILQVWGFYLEGVWLWRISGGYSQEMRGVGFSFKARADLVKNPTS